MAQLQFVAGNTPAGGGTKGAWDVDDSVLGVHSSLIANAGRWGDVDVNCLRETWMWIASISIFGQWEVIKAWRGDQSENQYRSVQRAFGNVDMGCFHKRRSVVSVQIPGLWRFFGIQYLVVTRVGRGWYKSTLTPRHSCLWRSMNAAS